MKLQLFPYHIIILMQLYVKRAQYEYLGSRADSLRNKQNHKQITPAAVTSTVYRSSMNKKKNKQAIAKQEANNLTEEVTIIFAGDISFDGPVRYYAKRKCSYNRSFVNIKPYLSDGDIIVANLESPFYSGDLKKLMFAKGKNIKHVAEPEAVAALKYIDVDIVTIANNHMLDASEEGFNETINTLEEADIQFIGMTTGRSPTTRQKPLEINVNGISIGFLAYCRHTAGCTTLRKKVKTGPALFSQSIVKKDIADLKDNVDIVVVVIHWGEEYLPMPPMYVRTWAFKLQQFGADIIIGGHPHVLQGHECIEKSLVCYSLGNFLFPKHGIAAVQKFLEGKEPDKDVVNEYEKKIADVYHQGQLSYLLKVKVNRNGIKDVNILMFEIKSEPKTFCLQPTPINGKWLKFCDVDIDPYCFDFPGVFAETFNMSRTNHKFKYNSGDLRKCIQGSSK